MWVASFFSYLFIYKMIILSANTTSTFTCQPDLLSQLSINSGLTSYYLFEFINNNSLNKYYVIPTQISAGTTFRTYQLTIPSSSTGNNLTGGSVYLPTAQYSYNIYEQVNQYNTAVTNTYSIVEVGLAQVIKNTVYNTAYTTTITNTNYIV